MLVAGIPDNMRLDVSGDQKKMAMVDSDLWNIADRIKEIDPNLIIIFHEGAKEPFVIMENGPDGVSRFVARYAELDQRILEDLRYMAHIPFDERLKKVEREIDAKNAALEAQDPEVMEWLASEMRRELKKANMIDPVGETFYGFNPKRKKA